MINISAVYKVTNNITGDFYIGSSKNVSKRWYDHKKYCTWRHHHNSKLYQAMSQYGIDNFTFEIIEETDNLKEREQYYIDLLNPSYNNYRAIGQDIERYIGSHKGWNEKHKEECRLKSKEYCNRLCSYEGETITLGALSRRFYKQGIKHYTSEAKEYLL